MKRIKKCIFYLLGGFALLMAMFLAVFLSEELFSAFRDRESANVWNALGVFATTFAAITALYASAQANRINKKMLKEQKKENDFLLQPQIRCYLKNYHLSGGTPYLVLVTENFGNILASDIDLDVKYPDGIKDAQFMEYLDLLPKTKFSLAPQKRLSTPITRNKEEDKIENIINSPIIIGGEFHYYDTYGVWKKGKIPKQKLSVDEFRLFDAINMRGDNTNE